MLYLVNVPPERGNQLAAFQSIKEEIFGRLPEDQEQNISAFFNDEEQTLHKFEGSVHTECALMGILSDAGSSDSPPSIQDIFKYNGNRLGNLPDIFKVELLQYGFQHSILIQLVRLGTLPSAALEIAASAVGNLQKNFPGNINERLFYRERMG